MLQNPPYVLTSVIANTDRIEIDGYYGDIWHNFESDMNFTTLIWNSEDGKWGSQNPDGSWNGMLGMIQKGKTEVALADMSIRPDRAIDFDYTFPTVEVRLVCTMLQKLSKCEVKA